MSRFAANAVKLQLELDQTYRDNKQRIGRVCLRQVAFAKGVVVIYRDVAIHIFVTESSHSEAFAQ